jgi:nitrite reductase (NADH) small subunit
MNSNHSLIKLADKKDIPVGKAIVVRIPNGQEIALYNLEGEIYALENLCPHMGGPLGEGDIEDSIVTCPWHGWQFDIKTGDCQNMPGDNANRMEIDILGDEIYLKGNGRQ